MALMPGIENIAVVLMSIALALLWMGPRALRTTTFVLAQPVAKPVGSD